MGNRKAGWALRKEYRDLLDKTNAMRSRIIKRAKELVKQYPDVEFLNTSFPYDKMITVSEYVDGYRLDVQAALNIIEKIEKHIADQHPHKQLEIILDTSGSMNPSKAEKDLIAAKSRNAEFKRSVNSVRIENPETKDKRDV